MRVRSAKDLGLMIREKRRQRGWDQQTLADRIGVSRLWISEMENGKRSVQLELVLRALAVLDIDLQARDTVTEAGAGKSASASRIRDLLDKL